jgi:hypothetical protein
MARIMTQVLGKPIRFQEVPGPGFKASLMQQRSSAAFAQSLAMFAEVDQGIYEAEPSTPETPPPTTFRRRCEEVLRPTVGGSS